MIERGAVTARGPLDNDATCALRRRVGAAVIERGAVTARGPLDNDTTCALRGRARRR